MSKRENTRWGRRDRKYRKRRYGMRVSGRSVKAILLPLIGRKAEEVKKGEPAPRRTRPGKPPFPRDPVRTGKRKRRKKRR